MSETELKMLTGASDADTGGPWAGKFATDGTPLGYGGTTVICHIDPTSPTFAALRVLQDTLRSAAPAGAFAWLPPDSFHMTLFDCTNEGRRGTAAWPAGLAQDAAIAACAAALLPRLEGLAMPGTFNLAPVAMLGASTVRLTGADAAAEARLRDTRDRLAAALRLRDPAHDSYGFHITLSYRLRGLTLTEAQALLSAQDAAGSAFRASCPVIELGRAEFCTFQTLHRFDRLAYL